MTDFNTHVDSTNALEPPLTDEHIRSQVDQLLTEASALSMSGTPDAINALLDSASQAAHHIGYTRALMGARYQQALLHYRLSAYPQAIACAREIYRYATAHHDDDLIYKSLNIIASVQTALGSYAEALDTFYQLYALLDQCDELQSHRGMVLYSIASVYQRAKDWSQALEHYARALDAIQQSDLPNRAFYLISTYENMSLTHAYQRDGEGALAAALNAMQISETHQLSVKNTTFLYVGKAYQLLGDFNSARGYFEKARAATAADSGGMIGSFFEGVYEQYQGELAIELGDYPAALDHLERALAVFTELNMRREALDVRESLYRLHKQQGDYARALDVYEGYSALKEQLYKEQADSRLKTIQALHDVETAHMARKAELERTEALQRELKEREEVITALEGYARTVAHDIKNPLNVLYGASNMLMDFGDTLSGEQFKRTLDLIFSSAEKSMKIVDSLLELAQMRKQAFTPIQVEMRPVVESAIKRLSDMIAKRRATVDIPEVLPDALGTASWIEQVWVNLISNAVKYGGTSAGKKLLGNPPFVRISAQLMGDCVRYGVHDNGNGITPAEQKRLFGSFVRLERHAGSVEGHGLGLSIVQMIVEKLGGQVWVESTGKAGEGAAFYFTLPAAQ